MKLQKNYVDIIRAEKYVEDLIQKRKINGYSNTSGKEYFDIPKNTQDYNMWYFVMKNPHLKLKHLLTKAKTSYVIKEDEKYGLFVVASYYSNIFKFIIYKVKNIF